MTAEARRATSRQSFAESIHGFIQRDLASHEAYAPFREALAALADESTASLGRFLADMRNAALSSVFGSQCPRCKVTVWPHKGAMTRSGDEFLGFYRCKSCPHTWQTTHDVAAVNWPA